MIRARLILLLALAGCGGSSASAGRAHAPVVGERGLDPSERADFGDLVAWAERVRDLRATRPPEVVAVDEPTLRRLAPGAIDDLDHPHRLTTYTELGLVPRGQDAATALGATLASTSVVAMYSSTRDRIVLPERMLPSLGGTSNPARLDQLVVLHEVVHALQDQHFGSDDAQGDPGDPDHDLALRSLVEGDATFAMLVALAGATGADVDAMIADPAIVARLTERAVRLSGLVSESESPSSELARMRATAPYFFGASFVARRYADGGWRAVDGLYGSADELTSEHVLHPERFESGDVREPLDPDELGSLRDGGERLDDTTLGELVLRVYFRSLGDAGAARAAAGWAGDRIRLYRRADGSLATWWITTWDSIRDAAEAADAARRVHAAQERTGSSSRLVVRHQRAVLIATGLTEAELAAAATTVERYVYDELDPLDVWPPDEF